MRSAPSLPSLPGPLWPGVVAPERVQLIFLDGSTLPLIVPYSAECWARRYQVPFFEYLVWQSGIESRSPGPLANTVLTWDTSWMLSSPEDRQRDWQSESWVFILHYYLILYIYIYILPLKSIWPSSKTFISHSRSVILNEARCCNCGWKHFENYQNFFSVVRVRVLSTIVGNSRQRRYSCILECRICSVQMGILEWACSSRAGNVTCERVNHCWWFEFLEIAAESHVTVSPPEVVGICTCVECICSKGKKVKVIVYIYIYIYIYIPFLFSCFFIKHSALF